MKLFICSNENQLLAAKVSKFSIIQRSKYTEEDIKIVSKEDAPILNSFLSKPYLRGGMMVNFDKRDMQSFTLLRFFIPELMGYSGKALVIDPDIFLVQRGLEKLEAFDFQESPIYARRGLRKNSWGSSVLLLDCNQLQHWSLKSFIHSLHEGTIDYDDLMSLKLEKSVSQLENKWNEFDEIKKDTILLHTTERITQPWRAGLKLNSSIKPILRIFPRAPIYRILGKDLTVGREHPSKKVAEFFFKELSKCISENCISMDEIDLAIERKFLREDIKEKIAFK